MIRKMKKAIIILLSVLIVLSGIPGQLITAYGEETVSDSPVDDGTQPQSIGNVVDLRIKTITNTSLTFEWDVVEGAEGYKLINTLDSSTILCTVESSSNPSCTVTGLNPSQYGTYGVYARLGNAESSEPATISAITTANTGEDIWATSIESNQVSISWDAVEGALRYEILRSGVELENDVTTTSFVDRTAQPDSSYVYIIRAIKDTTSEILGHFPVTTPVGEDIDVLMTTIEEDDFESAGDVLSTNNAITISEYMTENGQWQYFNGLGWFAVNADALSHRANTSIRFVPKENFFGTETLKYDENGIAKIAQITVSPINDTPGIYEKGNNNYLKFGTNQYVQYPDLGDSFYSNSFTFESWVRLDNHQTWARIFDTSYGPGRYNLHLSFMDNSSRMMFETKIPQPNNTLYEKRVITTDTFPLHKWVHVAAVYDKDSHMAYIYWDGILKAQGPMNLDSMSDARSSNDNIDRPHRYLGKSTWSQDAYFMGGMKDVRFWDKASTIEEINARMEVNSVTGNEPNLALHYPLNNPDDGTVAKDSTVNSNNGTIHGATGQTDEGFTSDLKTNAGQTVSKVFAVRDVDNTEVTQETLEITATSSDQSLIKNENINIEAAEEDEWTIAVTPEPSLSGTATITVTVEDGDGANSSSSYDVLILDSLVGLSLSSGTLNFNPNTTSYTVNVPNNVSSIKVTPIATSDVTPIRVNGTIVESGTASNDVDLTVGANVVTIVVKAQDGTTQTYTITVTRASAANAGGGSPTPQPETITVEVEDGTKGGTVSTVPITRTPKADGTKKDNVTYTTDKAKETVEKTKTSGSNVARIVIPDAKDEVSEVDVKLPVATTKELANGNLALEIFTDNVRISLPKETVTGLNEDLYFKVVPIKKEDERKAVEERAKKEEVVKEALGTGDAKVVGRPMTIETNLSSRAVDLVLPLKDVTLPTNAKEREGFLADLVVFIEHSDGDRVLVKPEVVEYKEGQLGLKFGITKFSTFTILNMDNWAEYLEQQEQNDMHKAYIYGYKDGTFRPGQNISRAQMAAILQRINAKTGNTQKTLTYLDVASNYWAKDAINYVSSNGLMTGLSDGTFAPANPITRAQMATIVARWLGLTETGIETASDVNGHWAQKSIELVMHAGIMGGMTDGTFHPNEPLTRAQAVVTINRILKRSPLNSNAPTWKDVPASHWAYGGIEEASQDHSKGDHK